MPEATATRGGRLEAAFVLLLAAAITANILRMGIPHALPAALLLTGSAIAVLAAAWRRGLLPRLWSRAALQRAIPLLWPFLAVGALLVWGLALSGGAYRTATIDLCNLALFAGLFGLAAGFAATPERASRFEMMVCRLLFGGALIAGLLGLGKLHLLFRGELLPGAPTGSSLMNDYNLYAFLLVAGIACQTALLRRGRRGGAWMLAHCAALAALEIALLATGSRRGFLLLAAGMIGAALVLALRGGPFAVSAELRRTLRPYLLTLIGVPLLLGGSFAALVLQSNYYRELRAVRAAGYSWASVSINVAELGCRYVSLFRGTTRSCFNELRAKPITPPLRDREDLVETLETLSAIGGGEIDIPEGASQEEIQQLSEMQLLELVERVNRPKRLSGRGSRVGVSRAKRLRYSLEYFREQMSPAEKLLGSGFDYLKAFGDRFASEGLRRRKVAEDHPHNAVVSAMLYSGLLGAAAQLALMAWIAWLALRRGAHASPLAWLSLIALAYALSSSNSLYSIPAIHTFPALLALHIAGREGRRPAGIGGYAPGANGAAGRPSPAIAPPPEAEQRQSAAY